MKTKHAVLIALALAAMTGWADDWPQWMGPHRDGVWREAGVIETIPTNGLPVKWRVPVGGGYSGPAVAKGRVFVMDFLRQPRAGPPPADGQAGLAGTERALCFDAATGQVLWKHEYPCTYHIGFNAGPRCTPTVDGDRVYALGAEGNLWCLDAITGRVIWSKEFTADYGAKTPTWGYAAHPLVLGDTLYVVTGSRDGVARALDKHTGQERWRALPGAAPGYCPPTLITHGGRQQLLIWHGEAVNSLDPQSGTVQWSVPLQPSAGMAIAAPQLAGDLLFASAYQNVGALLKLDATGAVVVWRGTPTNALYSGTATPQIVDDVIYGCDENTSTLMAVRLRDGARLWQTTVPTMGAAGRGRYGTAFLVRHADRWFLFSEQGDLILAKLSPQGYTELGRFHVLAPTNKAFGRSVVWSHPAYAQRCLFARNDAELVCVDLASKEK